MPSSRICELREDASPADIDLTRSKSPAQELCAVTPRYCFPLTSWIFWNLKHNERQLPCSCECGEVYCGSAGAPNVGSGTAQRQRGISYSQRVGRHQFGYFKLLANILSFLAVLLTPLQLQSPSCCIHTASGGFPGPRLRCLGPH